MPEIVKQLTEKELTIENQVYGSYSEEQICAYFLSKNLRSIYQFSDEFVNNWHSQIFESKIDTSKSRRIDLVFEYANMLMIEKKIENHMKYWVRQLQSEILVDMANFFDGDGGT